MSSLTGTTLGRHSRWAMVGRETMRALVAVAIALGVTFVD